MTVDAVQLAKLDLAANDLLVVKSEVHLTDDMRRRLKDEFAALYRGRGLSTPMIVCTGPDISIERVRLMQQMTPGDLGLKEPT